MALEFQNVFVPAVGGIDQSIHERVRPVDSFADVTNGEYVSAHEVEKRAGFVEVSNLVGDGSDTVADDGDVRGIFDGGSELLVLGHRQLYARNPTSRRFYSRGFVSPYGGTLKHRLRDERSYLCPDVYHNNGFVGYCAQVRSEFWNAATSEGTWKFAIEVIIYDENDARTFLSHTAEAVTIGPQGSLNGSDLLPHSPRMFGTGDKLGVERLHMACAEGAIGASAHDLKIYSYSSNSPGTAPSSPASVVTTDLWVDAAIIPINQYNQRTYDIIDAERTDFYDAAWIDDTAQNVNVRQYSGTSHAPALAAIALTTHAPYTRVAMCQDRSVNRRFLFVAAVGNDGGEEGGIDNAIIEVWARDADDYTLSWGPVTIHTYGTAGYVENIGIAHDGTNGKLMVTWTRTDTNGLSVSMNSRTLTDAGTPEQATVTVPNVFCFSRPFYEQGRPYVACCYDQVSELPNTALFTNVEVYTASLLVDLDPATSDRKPLMAGMWGVGESPPQIHSIGRSRNGVGHNVRRVSSGSTVPRYHLATMSVTEALRPANASPPYLPPTYSFGGDEVEIDFRVLPNAARVGRQAIVIGGGHLSYYDGDYVHELGFGSGPVISGRATTGSGTVPIGTYITAAHWEHTKNGVVHRSVPSEADVSTIASVGNVTWEAITLQLSHRKDDEVNLICSASDTDGQVPNMRRTSPFEVRENDTASPTVSFNWDGGSEFRDAGPIYTSIGPDLANVTPEGALVVGVGIERLWTGRHYAQDVIQYSDPFVPGTSAEDLIAPELNDALVKIAADGEEITFLIEMDDNMVIGTATSIYALTGEGPDNAGQLSDFPPLRRVTTDRGCTNRRSAVLTPDGIMFESDAGLFVLTRGFEVEFIGLAIQNELATYSEITSATLVPSRRQVRFTCTNAAGTAATILVYDYQFRAWSRWFVLDGTGGAVVPVGSCVHDGRYQIVTRAGRVFEQALSNPTTWRDTDADSNDDWVPMTVKPGWFQPAKPGSWLRVEEIMPFCRWMSAHNLRVKLYHDYEATAEKDTTYPNADLVSFEQEGVREQPEVSVTRPECQAITWELTDEDPGSGNGRGYTYGGATVVFGFQRGRARTPDIQRR